MRPRLHLVAAALVGAGLLLQGCRRHAPAAPDACTQGKPDACLAAAKASLFGHGVPRDARLAFQLFERACDLGSQEGCGAKGLLLISGAGAPSNPTLGAEMARKACDSGEGSSCLGLGRAYRAGRQLKLDEAEALKLFELACSRGEAQGCAQAGELRTLSLGTKDLAGALGDFKKGCDVRDAASCRHYAEALACGRGVQADTTAASRLLLEGCQRKDRAACAEAAELLASNEPFAAMAAPEVQADVELLELPQLLDAGRYREAEEILKVMERRTQGPFDRVHLLYASSLASRGELEGARAQLSALGPTGAADPAAAVLRELLAQPPPGDTGWPEALIRAWVRAGKPDLQRSALLVARPGTDALECTAHERHAVPSAPIRSADDFLRAYAHELRTHGSGRLFQAALKLAVSGPPMAQWVSLSILGSPTLTETEQKQAQGPSERALSALSARYPDSFYFTLFKRLGLRLASAPVDSSKLASLLSGAGQRTFAPPRQALFEAFLHALGGDVPANVQEAFSATVEVSGTPEFTGYAQVLAQASSSGSVEDRRNVVAFLQALASKMSEGTWLVDQAQGSYVARAAASVARSPDEVRAAQQLSDTLQGRWNAARGFAKVGIGSWDITPLTVEWQKRSAGDELGFYGSLVALGAG